ncbi:hypothetical protein Aph02nite_61790 [Actinoplanes philippinensis]|nr:hypothetical protein Aph02nite_61790 [Actinoplanes philippinensis]
MPSSRRPSDPVPHHPNHRRDWRTLWRRCICGLPAPCIDRFPPPPPPPYPRPEYPAPDQRTSGGGTVYRSRTAPPGSGAPITPDGQTRPAHPDGNVGRAGRLTPAQEHRVNQGGRRRTRRQPRSH